MYGLSGRRRGRGRKKKRGLGSGVGAGMKIGERGKEEGKMDERERGERMRDSRSGRQKRNGKNRVSGIVRGRKDG